MAISCTRCDQTGFLNIAQVPSDVADKGPDAVLVWMKNEKSNHDVQICDCCGDGEWWHGEAGEHAPGEPCDCG